MNQKHKNYTKKLPIVITKGVLNVHIRTTTALIRESKENMTLVQPTETSTVTIKYTILNVLTGQGLSGSSCFRKKILALAE